MMTAQKTGKESSETIWWCKKVLHDNQVLQKVHTDPTSSEKKEGGEDEEAWNTDEKDREKLIRRKYREENSAGKLSRFGLLLLPSSSSSNSVSTQLVFFSLSLVFDDDCFVCPVLLPLLFLLSFFAYSSSFFPASLSSLSLSRPLISVSSSSLLFFFWLLTEYVIYLGSKQQRV